MPEPYTDEAALITGLGGGQTLDDLYVLLLSIDNHLAVIRARAEEGQLPPAALLSNEFIMRSDLDGGRGLNGSVYGRDFQIDPDDPDFPPALLAIHDHPLWPEAGPPSISWQAYLSQWL